MRIILTNHARERAAQRGISKQNIEEALSSVEMTMPGTPSGFKCQGRTAQGRALIVVLVDNPATSGKAVVKIT